MLTISIECICFIMKCGNKNVYIFMNPNIIVMNHIYTNSSLSIFSIKYSLILVGYTCHLLFAPEMEQSNQDEYLIDVANRIEELSHSELSERESGIREITFLLVSVICLLLLIFLIRLLFKCE